MMRKRHLFQHCLKLIMLGNLSLFAGCNVAEVSSLQLKDTVQKHSAETINQLWYMGSDRGKDYFCHCTAFSRKKYATSDEGFALDRFPLTREKQSWKLVSTKFSAIGKENDNIKICTTALFSIADLFIEKEDSHNPDDGHPSYYIHEAIGRKPHYAYDDEKPNENTFELSCWMAYSFIRYSLCDNLLSGKKINAGESPVVFGTPLSEYIAYRCHLVIFPDLLSKEPDEYIAYKFLRKKDGENVFVFALYFDVKTGEIDLCPSQSGRRRKILCTSLEYCYYLLDRDEAASQYEAEKQKRAIYDMKFNKKFGDRITIIDEGTMQSESQ